MISNRLERFAKFFVLLIGLFITGYLTIIKLTQTGYMVMETTEYIQFYSIGLLDWFVVLSILFLLLLILKFTNKISAFWIFLFGSLIYLFLGTRLILGVDPIPRSDPRYVWEAAIALNKGDYSTFSESGLSDYLSIFPNQIGLVTMFRFLVQISEDIRFIWFIQLGLVLINILLLWGISNLLFNNQKVSKFVLILSFLFLPSLFLILWAYGDILGLTGLLFASYFLILFDRVEHQNWFLPTLAFYMLMLSITVRSNYAIFGLALISIYILKLIKKRNLIPIVMIAMISVSLVAPNKINHLIYEKIEHQTIPQGTPLKAWVVMGLGERAANPGYWDGYTTLLPVWYNFNQEEMKKRIDDDFSSRLKELTSDTDKLIEFLKQKIQVTWNEPTYQSVYVGPLKPREQEAKTPVLQNFYEEGLLYQIYHSYMTALMIIVYFGCTLTVVYQLFSLISGQATDSWHFLMLVALIGAFIFHLFWETKSRYVYPFVFLMIPYLSWGYYSLISAVKRRFFEKQM